MPNWNDGDIDNILKGYNQNNVDNFVDGLIAEGLVDDMKIHNLCQAKSQSSSSKYTISIKRDADNLWDMSKSEIDKNEYMCSCMAWTRSNPRKNCKHIIDFLNNRKPLMAANPGSWFGDFNLTPTGAYYLVSWSSHEKKFNGFNSYQDPPEIKWGNYCEYDNPKKLKQPVITKAKPDYYAKKKAQRELLKAGMAMMAGIMGIVYEILDKHTSDASHRGRLLELD